MAFSVVEVVGAQVINVRGRAGDGESGASFEGVVADGFGKLASGVVFQFGEVVVGIEGALQLAVLIIKITGDA